MSEVESAAPAQPEATATPAPVLTAVESAVAKDDFTAYRDTRRAERSGTPAPAPAADPAADTPPAALAPPAEESRQVSKRQQQINAYERRIAEQDQRIRALESSATPAPPAAPRTEPVAGETFPAYAEHLEKNPDETLEGYFDKRVKWLRQQEARAEADSRREADHARSQQESVSQAHARTLAARAADPAIDAKFTAWEQPGAELPDVLFIKTRDQAIAARQIPLAENDFASAIATSEFSAQLIAHIADHPEILERVRALENRTAVNKFVGKLESRFEKADPAPTPVQPKTISSAPEPGTALGSRPASAADPLAAAVKAGDVTAYRAARQAQRASARR